MDRCIILSSFYLPGTSGKNKQSIQATLPIYPVPHRDHYDKYHLVCQEGHVNSRTFLFLFVLALSRVDHVISRKALGVWSEHTTLMTALKLSFVVIHLQWSNTACLTWIRGQKGALQGTCLVITFVLHCAKVRTAIQQQVDTIQLVLFAFNKTLIGFLFIFNLIVSHNTWLYVIALSLLYAVRWSAERSAWVMLGLWNIDV